MFRELDLQMSMSTIALVSDNELGIIQFLDKLLQDEPKDLSTTSYIDVHSTGGACPDVSTCDPSWSVASQLHNIFVDVPLQFDKTDSIGGRQSSLRLDVEENLVHNLHMPPSKARGVTSERHRRRY